MEFNEVANIYPLIEGEEFDSLVEDIRENGLIEPIWLDPDDGSILDGRNRYLACIEAGVAPEYRTWGGTGSRVSFVVSLNSKRRHLSTGQRAMAAAAALPFYEAEAKKRQGERNDLVDSDIVAKLPQCSEGKARDAAARDFNVSARYVSDAKKIQAESLELADKIRSGEMNISKAKREISNRQKLENPPLPIEGKYRVWYADPPWSYGNSGVISESDNYGRAERHYPSMKISELCDMGADIKQSCEDDAVLFMWVTSPLLAECFDVIKAWGFKYKSSFVWDKISHNFAHYNSMRHELLLVCTKGSCLPDSKKLIDSVQSIEKSRKHSEKPSEFREIIDELYTAGNRIELFARKGVDGWDLWGNESDDYSN